MARLIEPEKLKCYRNALANWRYEGFIKLNPLALELLEREIAQNQREFGRLLYEYLQSGGEIDQVAERRAEWSIHEFHYDLRPTLEGRVLYVETVLDYRDAADPNDPIIYVVNIHLA